MRDPRVDQFCHGIRNRTPSIRALLKKIGIMILSAKPDRTKIIETLGLIVIELEALENMARRLTEEENGARITF